MQTIHKFIESYYTAYIVNNFPRLKCETKQFLNFVKMEKITNSLLDSWIQDYMRKRME